MIFRSDFLRILAPLWAGGSGAMRHGCRRGGQQIEPRFWHGCLEAVKIPACCILLPICLNFWPGPSSTSIKVRRIMELQSYHILPNNPLKWQKILFDFLKNNNRVVCDKVVLDGCVSWPLGCYNCNNPGVSSCNLLEWLYGSLYIYQPNFEDHFFAL